MDNLVRRIKVTDYRDIFLLNKDFNPTLDDFSEAKVQATIDAITKNDKDVVFVYEQDGQVLGYIHGSPYTLLFSEPVVNVLGFVVKESHRNQGIGGKLIDRLEAWARDNGYFGMKLLTHPDRALAHKFYELRGYVFTKDQKNYMKKFMN